MRADDKRLARLNIIKDLLGRLHYADNDERLTCDMLSALSAHGVEKQIGEVRGVESVTVNYAARSATVRLRRNTASNRAAYGTNNL